MQNGPRRAVLHLIQAERAGFEPAVGDYPTHAFQAGYFFAIDGLLTGFFAKHKIFF